ncbi:MAG: hypothetical protein IJJ33_18830 [Victivallales bacterium]|nr:hypothetical protein [Victivallales bacterium]
MTDWEKWCWIELIGFDNGQSDFGVGDFLARQVKKPQYVVLLASSCEVINAYEPDGEDFTFQPGFCSYMARPYNQERRRQAWRATQLRGLLAELRRCGIRTFLCLFNGIDTKENAFARSLTQYDEWAEAHRELWMKLADGTLSPCICPWKKMADGTAYEDFFATRLEQFLHDFDFAGFMFGDGLNTSRGSLIEAEFSAETIARFEQGHGISIPAGDTVQQAEFILAHHRWKWCQFLTSCQSSFLKKTAAAVHRADKLLACLSAWCKDPMEAIWRYATDYRVLRECDLYALVVESSAGTVELEGWNEGEDTTMLDRNRATLLCLKAALPNTKLIQLHCVKDDQEQYCVLRHAPSMLATEIMGLATMMFADTGKNCVEGVESCLSDGISAHEWKVMDETWDMAFTLPRGKPESPLLVWHPKAMDRELEEYSRHRRCDTNTTLSHLIANGLPLAWSGTVAGADRESDISLLIVHPAFWPEEELKRLLCRKPPVFLVGIQTDGAFGAEVWSESRRLAAIRCELLPDDRTETLRFWHTLPEAKPENSFWLECVKLFRTFTAFPVRGEAFQFYDIIKFDPRHLRVWSYDDGLCLVSNMGHGYLPARFQPAHPVTKVQSLTFYPCLPVKPIQLADGVAGLSVKVPPLGTAVLRCFQTSPDA